jgi:hypothetical protein
VLRSRARVGMGVVESEGGQLLVEEIVEGLIAADFP